jgi:hypothetical protein
MLVLGLSLGPMHHAIPVLGWAIEGVELPELVAGIDHIVPRAGRHNEGVLILKPDGGCVDQDLALPVFDARKVAVLVRLLPISSGGLRDECLNQHWFGSLTEAARVINAWRQHYNGERPRSALGYEPPARFARGRGAPGLDGGPRPLASTRSGAEPTRYELNSSPPPWT